MKEIEFRGKEDLSGGLAPSKSSLGKSNDGYETKKIRWNKEILGENMKVIIIILLLLIIIPCNAKNGWEYHFTFQFAGSYLLAYGLDYIGVKNAGRITLATGIGIGCLKELNDPKFSWADMGYNAAGCTIGVCFALKW